MMSRNWRTVLVSVVACCPFLVSCNGTRPAPPGEPHVAVRRTMNIQKDAFGTLPDGRQADVYTLTNANGMRARLTNFGALTLGVEVPGPDGTLTDVALGWGKFDQWLSNPAYFGATVGRYANRIAKGKFTLDGKTYSLATNNGPNHLHGGIVGFNKVLWNAETVTTDDAFGVKFTYLSKDGEEGYPGNLSVTAVYTLAKKANEFRVQFSATTDRPTIVNLAHHTYWNLAGPAAGDVLGHELLIQADQFTPVDEGLIPTGELKPVKGTPLDFTTPTAIGARIAQVEGGYDHNYVLRGEPGTLRLAARVVEPASGRVMELWTDQPGMQFYSGNFLDGSPGKGGVACKKHYGFCLESQTFPDSPNKPDFPSPVLRPGQTYTHTMVHKFSAQ